MKTVSYQTPDAEYEAKKAAWEAPLPRPRALPGKVIVEYLPFGVPGPLWHPEAVGNNAMVVSDGYEYGGGREGFLPCGTEVAYTGVDGVPFDYQGRKLWVLPKREIEVYFPKQKEAVEWLEIYPRIHETLEAMNAVPIRGGIPLSEKEVIRFRDIERQGFFRFSWEGNIIVKAERQFLYREKEAA